MYQVNSEGYCTLEYHYWISLAAEALLHWGEAAGEVDDRQSFLLRLKCIWLRGRNCQSGGVGLDRPGAPPKKQQFSEVMGEMREV